MDRGMDFLRSQVNNAVMQHQTFLDSLVDHEREAKDSRFSRPVSPAHSDDARAVSGSSSTYQQQLGTQSRVG